MQAWKFLCSLPHVPMQFNGNQAVVASNSEKRRWLQNRSVIINGVKPDWKDEICFPVTELVFFPKSNRRTTML
jgi:hypothetical protein